MPRRLLRNPFVWVAAALVVVLGGSQLLGGGSSRESLRFDEFVDRMEAGEVADADI